MPILFRLVLYMPPPYDKRAFLYYYDALSKLNQGPGAGRTEKALT
jgi:hypothetical protein